MDLLPPTKSPQNAIDKDWFKVRCFGATALVRYCKQKVIFLVPGISESDPMDPTRCLFYDIHRIILFNFLYSSSEN
jgi:hypothetical protein